MATLTQQLAAFVTDLTFDRLPREVVQKAKSCLLNGLGVGMAAHDSQPARLAEAAALELGGAGRSTTIISGAKTTPASAAFANAVLFNSRNQSDSYHTATHFGPPVIPAALAVAEQYGCSGRAVLEAVVAGYEVAGAMARAHVELGVERGWRASPIFAGFGSAAATSKLRDLDAQQTANALGFAACFAAGNVECIIAHSMESQMEMGQCSFTGIMSAQLARHGGRSAPTAIEGQAGYLNLYLGTTEHQQTIVEELGRRFEIMDVTFKRYPLSMIAQSPAWMALALKAETGVDPASIESVLVELNAFESEYPGKGRVGAEESSNERYTLLGVATALAHGRITRDLLRKRDDTVVTLMSRSSYVGRDDVAPLCARLTVRAGGQEFHREVTDGAQHHFLDYIQVAELVAELAPETRGAQAAVQELTDLVPRFEDLPDVSRVMELAATRS